VSRVRVFGITVDRLTTRAAIDRILDLAKTGGRHVAVTPNLDHVVLLRTDQRLRDVYAIASLVLADGMPLVWASRIGGALLPERVAGSDLVAPVLAGAERNGLSVFFLGPMPETLSLALARCAADYPRLRIAGSFAPPRGFEEVKALDDACVAAVRESLPDVLFVSLGCPKQDHWIGRHRNDLPFGVALCVGAGVDFFAGVVQRCPRLVAMMGGEWLWRLIHEPRRLWRRYAQCLLLLPGLVVDQFRDAYRPKSPD